MLNGIEKYSILVTYRLIVAIFLGLAVCYAAAIEQPQSLATPIVIGGICLLAGYCFLATRSLKLRSMMLMLLYAGGLSVVFFIVLLENISPSDREGLRNSSCAAIGVGLGAILGHSTHELIQPNKPAQHKEVPLEEIIYPPILLGVWIVCLASVNPGQDGSIALSLASLETVVIISFVLASRSRVLDLDAGARIIALAASFAIPAAMFLTKNLDSDAETSATLIALASLLGALGLSGLTQVPQTTEDVG